MHPCMGIALSVHDLLSQKSLFICLSMSGKKSICNKLILVIHASTPKQFII